jgi:hypothetical protein
MIRGTLASLRASILHPSLVACALVVVPGVARAAVRVPTPHAWSEAVPAAARARAEAWAPEGASVAQVMSPSSRDAFAETLALVQSPTPLHPDDLGDDDLGRARWIEASVRMFGVEGEPEQFARLDTDPVILSGSWTTDTTVIRMALIPSGATHAALVMEVERGSDVLYASVFDDELADLQGAAAPVTPFPRVGWIWGTLALWIVGAAAAAFVILLRSRPTPGPAAMGRRLAWIALALTFVVAITVYIAAGGQELPLTLAGVSRSWLAIEVSWGGLGLAGLCWGLGQLAAREQGIIDSAPTAGTYASRGPTTGPRPAVAPAPTAPAPRVAAPPPPPPPPPVAIPLPDEEPAPGFPAPGQAEGIDDLLLDEPAARLEVVHPGAPEQAASLATAQISLDGRRRGARFDPPQ